ncbi:hypothetical protein M413DRAFT_443256 [Hebeloma cylindrosporum]|uniref:Uncharacterized protein n=1 Tax=Hebeloma cylindrosporum TaxID=76867 RepID=A0A0C2YTB0_HEBCY|nr:hypothetical protein M413DRAFT_443256 [Hebeloma cylindrosporum h7]
MPKHIQFGAGYMIFIASVCSLLSELCYYAWEPLPYTNHPFFNPPFLFTSQVLPRLFPWIRRLELSTTQDSVRPRRFCNGCTTPRYFDEALEPGGHDPC